MRNASAAAALAIVVLAGSVCLSSRSLVNAGGGNAPPDPVVSATVPPEVDVPNGFPGNPIDFFDDYSWRIFLALNWPAKADVRGQADGTKDLTNANLAIPRVWETWKSANELFQPGGLKPTDWTSFDAITPCTDVPALGSGKVRILGSFTQFGDLNEAALGEAGSPLVAQNQTYARYEIRVNQPEFEFIVAKGFYLAKNLPDNQTPVGPSLQFTNGSIELKGAWKELKTPQDVTAAKGKYYTIDAKVPATVVGNPSETKKFALVGLHIVQKTPKRPQWVWSSFEHVDNIPSVAAPPAPAVFSFNDPTKVQKLNPAIAPDPLSVTNPPKVNPNPMQVVRGLPIHPNTKATNTKYQNMVAGTVWANYQLVMTQWPTKTMPADGPGAPFPGPNDMTCTANSSMETYFQTSTSQSCMSCHDSARTSGTDFVWFVQLRAFSTDVAAKSLRMKAIIDSMERLKPADSRDPKRLLKK